MVDFDIQQQVNQISKAEAQEGKLSRQHKEDKLMHSVLQSNKKEHDQAELVQEATNRGVGSFTPELMFEQLVENFSMAKHIYGPKLIRLLSGYDPSYIERNAKIPEFQEILRDKLKEAVQELQDKDIVDREGAITKYGYEVGSMVLVQELDKYIAKDKLGEKTNKKEKHYGQRAGVRDYRKCDRYKDINLRKSVHKAVKRQHKTLHKEDLMTSEREGKGKISIILGLDASASMKGLKLETCKKAGTALAYKAVEDKDDIGLVVFGSKIKAAIQPCQDFNTILNTITTIKASKQTDFAAMISKSIELFKPTSETKHLIIITDALPTVGEKPEKDTLQAVSAAKGAGITTSLIGIRLEKAGLKLAEQITRIGEGKLSLVKQLDKLGHFVLEDYYAFK